MSGHHCDTPSTRGRLGQVWVCSCGQWWWLSREIGARHWRHLNAPEHGHRSGEIAPRVRGDTIVTEDYMSRWHAARHRPNDPSELRRYQVDRRAGAVEIEAHDWSVDADGRLTLDRDGRVVATYPSGDWSGIRELAGVEADQ